MSQLITLATHGQGVPIHGAHWLTGKILDPTGRVFIHEGTIYRYVYPAAAARVLRMFETGVVDELVGQSLLISTTIADRDIPGGGLVLRHQKVPFLTGTSEWSRLQLRDAALAWIDLNLALAPRGLATADAHCGNFAQTGMCQPTWIDFGSITELRRADQALPEFRRYYRNPLQLASRSSGLARLVRAMTQTGGLNDYELSSLRFASIPLVGRPLQNGVDRLRRGWRKLLARFGPKPAAHDPSLSRETLLLRERTFIENLQFPNLGTFWGEYHSARQLHHPTFLPPSPRRTAILNILDQLRPRRLIDLASNAGFYSFHAASLGADVLAIDFDEKAVERLYASARQRPEKWNLTAACGNVMQPPPERIGLRCEADVVLALALTHHLAISQGYSIPTILDTLARPTTDKLLVEFMPHGLGGIQPLPDPLPEWYRRDYFESELSARFQNVRIITENQRPQWRVLYLAEGKRPH
jgi:hypothetical protein